MLFHSSAAHLIIFHLLLAVSIKHFDLAGYENVPSDDICVCIGSQIDLQYMLVLAY